MRVLMALWGVGGQVPVEIGVARRLINAGHQVTVVGEPTTQPAATTVGARFTHWVTAPTAVEDDIADWECRTPLTLFPRSPLVQVLPDVSVYSATLASSRWGAIAPRERDTCITPRRHAGDKEPARADDGRADSWGTLSG